MNLPQIEPYIMEIEDVLRALLFERDPKRVTRLAKTALRDAKTVLKALKKFRDR